MRKSRVLVVGAFPPPAATIFGGVVTVCRNLVQSSFSDRFDLVLVDSTQRSNPPPGLIRRALSGCVRAVKYLRAVMARPDAVVLFCSVGWSTIEKGLMARLARILGLPVFIFPQSGRLIDVARQSRLGRLWIGWALRSGTHMLCQGPAWHRFATEDLGYSPDRAPVVPNWTATDDLLDIGRNRRWADDATGELNLLFLGWVEREKGIFELLESCRALSDRYAFRLTIAGKGRAERAAKDFVAENGLADRVDHPGWVKGEGLLRVLEDADVLVLPSWAEGLPNAMIEGMAAGLAVVVSSVGNVPDVVRDGRDALLVPPGDVAALTGALERVLADASLRRALSTAGHHLVERDYSVEPAIVVLSTAIARAIANEDRSRR